VINSFCGREKNRTEQNIPEAYLKMSSDENTENVIYGTHQSEDLAVSYISFK